MIRKIDVTVSFPLGAHFNNNIYISVYRRLIAFIKDLMCFNFQSKCVECPMKNECRYYKLTGNNFSDYPGILIENDLFVKRNFNPKDQLTFSFFFVGNNWIYVDYIELFFQQLRQSIFGQFFYLKEINKGEVEATTIKISTASCMTPIESINFSDSYNQMILFYNNQFETEFNPIQTESTLNNPKQVSWNPVFLKTRKVKVNGYIGQLILNEEIDKRIVLMGIGKYNYLGGGHLAIKT